MTDEYLLKNKVAEKLYESVKDLPILDYHCHLSPKEIYEDKPYNNIGEMWLSGDHYKWRLMRAAGINERYITGDAGWKDKFLFFIQALSMAAGNPLYHWAQMELSMYFNINKPLDETYADGIWQAASKVIKEQKLSPRQLIKKAGVEYICTTDDISDTLEYHKKLREDKTFDVKVVPSFRTDNLLLILKDDYADYIRRLSLVSEIYIDNIDTLQNAIIKRLDEFQSLGCKFSDVGIPYFTNKIADKDEANDIFIRAVQGQTVLKYEYSGFLGYMYCFLAKEYKKRNMVMQWHLAVQRNANTLLYDLTGADSGGDCIGDVIKGKDIVFMLNEINKQGGLPKTIIYTLNSAMLPQLVSIAGSFPSVVIGAAWWYNDHKRGITEVINTIAEVGYLGNFTGMLTDSRSFLSYARFDYFRRILCSIIGEWVELGEYNEDSALRLVKTICYGNARKLIGGVI